MGLIEYKGTLSKIEDIGENVRNFTINLDKEIEFKSGQFVNLSFEDGGEIFTRSYSIASLPKNKNQIELCIKKVETGKVTPHLFKKKENDILTIKGPFGLFTLDKSQKEKLVFIATGTGIAPFRSMVKDIIEKKIQKEVILIYGTRYENFIAYHEEFEKIEFQNPNFKYYSIISKPTQNWNKRIGHVQDNLDMIDPLNSDIFICGLPAMIESVIVKLKEKGVQAESIHFEKY